LDVFQPGRKVAAGVAAMAALALGGSAIAGAASSQSTASQSGSSTQPSRAAFPTHGTAAHENLEKPVTGAAAAKAEAAAVKSVGGRTAGAVTTDVSGNGYEVTVTKSDGSKVEVHLDRSFNVAQGRGHGRGDCDGDGRSAGAPSGSANGT
jgi:hypothetical protein